MSDHHCAGCDGSDVEPTAEEIEAARIGRELALEARMVPARSPEEQTERDFRDLEDRMAREMVASFFATAFEGPERLMGLIPWAEAKS